MTGRARLVLFALVIGGGARAAPAAAPAVIVIPDSIRAGISVTDMLDAQPPGYRVRWINWDSGSGLEVGDRIIAVDDKPLVIPPTQRERQRVVDRSVGHMFEAQGWAEAGVKDGAPLSLTVMRRAPGQGMRTLTVKGTLRGERRYKGADGRNTLGPAGPAAWAREVTDDSWDVWYAHLVERWQRALDGGWQTPSLSNRSELDALARDRPRYEFLLSRYPGPFASALKDDWERVRTTMLGAAYRITDKDLEYRKAAQTRATAVAAAGARARDAFLAAHAKERIEPFPAIDALKGNRKAVAGKLVALPPLTNRNWVSEAGKCFMTSGDRSGWYFAACDAPATRRLFDAGARYQRLVDPKIGQTHELIARITGEPSMLVIADQATTGLAIEIVAATVGNQSGGQMFVDLTQVKDGASPFAGEDALVKQAEPPLLASATPRQVIEAFVRALKAGQEDAWTQLFATWRAERRSGGYAMYLPVAPVRVSNEWVSSRMLILDRVYDVRVVWVGDVERILTDKDVPRAPAVDQVAIEVDHVGKFDGDYRPFNGVAIHRTWLLQRINGGPWRIASIQGI